jgi:hypothetical protein
MVAEVVVVCSRVRYGEREGAGLTSWPHTLATDSTHVRGVQCVCSQGPNSRRQVPSVSARGEAVAAVPRVSDASEGDTRGEKLGCARVWSSGPNWGSSAQSGFSLFFFCIFFFLSFLSFDFKFEFNFDYGFHIWANCTNLIPNMNNICLYILFLFI